MQETVNIKEYLDIFKRRKWIMIIVILLSLALGGYKTYKNYNSYVPTYTSSVTVRINTMKEYEAELEKLKKQQKEDEKNGTSSSSATSSNEKSELEEKTNLYNSYSSGSEMRNQNIASSYVALTKKEPFRKKLSALSGIKVSQLGSVTATQNEDMPTFVDLTVVASSPEITKKVAEAAPEAYNEELKHLVKADCVEVVYEATTPTLIPRSKDLTLVKYLGVAIVVSIFLVLLVECLDTKIKTPKDVEKYWDLPLIGVIPMDDKRVKGAHAAKNGGRR
ncbi:MAG: hypothetical protein Q4E31_09490 [Intestinibacter bartlettii]|uniref:YveK family protein n=1 Tax=Intestinibacter bartlettii TaxID=261299 RepID=UPI0026F0C54E|nr:hypothetical protein [Intestinibacter bartlettii]MDO5011046.1 hypothetical protein [Intestinibacter bartlettii]